MKTFILPGYSDSNREWVDETYNNLKTSIDVEPIYWKHWFNKKDKFDAKEKAFLMIKAMKGNKINIIAKSVSTLVTSLANDIAPEKFEKVIFCGIPINDLDKKEIDLIKKFIKSKKNKFIGFQNEFDPHGIFDQVKDFGNIIKTKRDDHSYPFFDRFKDFLK